MRTTGTLKEVYTQGGKTVVAFYIDSDVGVGELRQYERLDIKAERHVNKRSNTANGYMWALISEIAKAIGAPTTEVYRECIRRAGVVKVFDDIDPAKAQDAVRLLSEHNDRGTGDFAEVIETKEKTVVALYFGSSKYNAREFSRLLDEVIDEAKELGIDIITQTEIDKLKANYEKYIAK